MKKLIVIMFLFITSIIYSQNLSSKDWIEYPHNYITEFTITKSKDIKFQNLTFKAKWNKALSYSENLNRHYGGIDELKIYHKNVLLQIVTKIEDQSAMDEIIIYFYDYNMDGYTDFSIRSECGKSCYYDYYLYNPNKKKFIYNNQWDGIRIALLNKKTKQLVTLPEGTALASEQELFKIVGDNLVLVKVIPSKP